MKQDISGHILNHLANCVRQQGGDVLRLAEETGIAVERLSDTDSWLSDKDWVKILVSCRRLYPNWNIPFEAGKSLLPEGLASLKDSGLIFRESPGRLLELFMRRYCQFHKSVEIGVELETGTSAKIEIRFENKSRLTREACDFLSGVVYSIPDLIELRKYWIEEISCAAPPSGIKYYRDHLLRVSREGEVMEYGEPTGGLPGKSKVVGRVSREGTFSYRGVLFGASSSVFRMNWNQPHWYSKPTGLTKKEKLRNTSARLDQAKDVISLANERIGGLETQVSESKRQVESFQRFIREVKPISSLHELLSLVTVYACTGFDMDRAGVYMVRGARLEIISFYDPEDVQGAQKAFADCSAHPIPRDGEAPEAVVARTGQPMIVEDPWNNLRVNRTLLEAWDTRAYAVLPIQGREEVIGVLLTDYRRRNRKITKEDLIRLNRFTSLVGLAMDKINVIGTLEEKVLERTKALQAANKKMSLLYRNAKEAEKVKSDYLASMSHELRTPLNSIIGFSKVMLKGMDGEINDKQQQDLSAIHQSGVHLLELINDILDLSKIEAGHMELHREHFDLNELVKEVAETSIGLAVDKQVALDTDLDKKLPFLYADKMRVRQILVNLASNAIKFTDSGRVTLKTRQALPNVYFAVVDTGLGMTADELQTVFLEFRQAGIGSKKKRGGTGLGLALCKQFAEMHGGKIWVSSTLGVGSTFHVELPGNR